MGPTKGGGWGTGVLHITQGTRPPSRVHAIRFTLGVRRLALLLLGARPPHRARQHPRGCPNIEIRGLTSDVRHAPALQILIERRGEVEHVAHARDAADVPRTDVLIERVGSVEHVAHVRDAAGACGRQGRVIPCINKCVDLSFRSLGVCDPSHFACIT